MKYSCSGKTGNWIQGMNCNFLTYKICISVLNCKKSRRKARLKFKNSGLQNENSNYISKKLPDNFLMKSVDFLDSSHFRFLLFPILRGAVWILDSSTCSCTPQHHHTHQHTTQHTTDTCTNVHTTNERDAVIGTSTVVYVVVCWIVRWWQLTFSSL